jgi:hypothetical protein
VDDIHYRPPWYPNRDPTHNPWTITDPISGKTHYSDWCSRLPKGELLRLIALHCERIG